jgi:hypothetical protein
MAMGQPAMGGTSSLCVGVKPRGFTRKARTSRMNREIHVRICGGLEVRFLRSTRRRPDAKGETQVGSTHEGESTDAVAPRQARNEGMKEVNETR